MISYAFFKKKIKKDLDNILAANFEDYAGWTLADNERFSINRKIEFLELHPPKDSPAINAVLPSYRYLPMYNRYLAGYPIKSICEEIAENMIGSMIDPPIPIEEKNALDEIMDPKHIYISLIGRKLNSELLKTIPHVDFLDLAVIFRAVMPSENGEYAAIVNNQILEDLGMSTEELLAVASENSFRDFPPKADFHNGNYCLTCDTGTICSHALVSDQLLYDTAMKAGCNLFVVPITLKFSVAFPENDNTMDDLESASRRMSARICDEDKLSDRLYYYDRHSHKLSLCYRGQVCEEDCSNLYKAC